VQSWSLSEIETPDGARSPVVLYSGDAARAVLIALAPGERLGVHQVKETAFVAVVEGSAQVEAGDESSEAGVGALFAFEPDERHSISSDGGARLLLFLAPWPGEGHYRGEESELGQTS
jgi:quercetin dioxygenase-like cupin family protein